eukprot:1667456-Amphidinium_carterae.1
MHLTQAEWWTQFNQMFGGSSTQDLYDYWLLGLNSWLGLEQANCDKSHSIRGSAQYFFDEGEVSRHVPRTESDTWRLHVLKKALAWAREIAAHEAGGCPSCDQC